MSTTTTTRDPREPNSTPPQTLNPDLQSERSHTPFRPLSITHFLDGGSPTNTERRRLLESWIIRDPTGIFSNEDNNYLHRTERHTRALAKFVRLVELCRAAGIGATSNGNNNSNSNSNSNDNNEVVDHELSATELRFKYALEKDEDVTSAIEAARRREREFFGTTSDGFEMDLDTLQIADTHSGSSWSTNLFSFDDEEGIEADLETGVHKSFIYRHRSQHFEDNANGDGDDVQNNPSLLLNVEPDPTLLCGLDAFMTNSEQQFLTSLLISGDTNKLAAAMEMMHYVSELSRQGIRPTLKRQTSSRAAVTAAFEATATSSSTTNGNNDDNCTTLGGKYAGNGVGTAAAIAGVGIDGSVGRSMLESIREVIREGNEARQLEQERGSACHEAGVVARQLLVNNAAALGTGGGGGMANNNTTGGKLAVGKRDQKRRNDLELRKRMEYMRLHPLPVRMPKYAELRACKSRSSWSFALKFIDDAWDGTVLDAYSKITVTKGLLGTITVTKRHAESRGIRDVIDACPSSKKNGTGIIDIERPRVIVASMSREGGQQGIVKGDVVTHFNGEEFDGTAEDLMALVDSRREGETLTFAFNADRAVAEALRRRSLISGR